MAYAIYAILLALLFIDETVSVSRQHEHGERAHRLLIRGTSANCRRVCFYRVNEEKTRFNVSSLPANFCSHLIIRNADLELTGEVRLSNAIDEAIKDYRAWQEVRKPVLVLSVGGETDGRVWRRVVQSSAVRRRFVKRLAQLYSSLDVDGIEIAWSHGVVSPKDSFAKLLTELRRDPGFPEYAVLIASVTAESTYEGGYDISVLNSTTNFLIVEGSRVGVHELVVRKGIQNRAEPKETLAMEWEASGIDRKKLVLGYSVATPSKWNQTAYECPSSQVSAEVTTPQSTKSLRGIGVIAFAVGKVASESAPVDGRLSMKARTLWASHNKFGGIALHGIENDRAQCDQKDAFPVLRAVAENQFC